MSASSTDTRPTTLEVIQSLTGYEERSILTRFGKDAEDLNGAMLLRTLVFVVEKRKSDAPESEKAAFKVAMDMTRAALDEFFAPASEDEAGGDESGEA